MPPNRLSPATLADLMREVGIEPSAQAQVTESMRRPPLRGAYWERPGPAPSREEQQRAFNQQTQRGAIQRDLGRREAYDPGIDPNTGMTQAQEALLYNLEPTGVPSLFRSYNSFQEGRPLEGAGHGALGLLGALGTASLAATPARQAATQASRLPMRSTPAPRSGPPPLYELDDSAASVQFRPSGEYRLGDVLDHPALYARHPNLADHPIHLGAGGRTVAGEAGPDAIRIDPRWTAEGSTLSNSGYPEFRKIVLHEVQHEVDRLEGRSVQSGTPSWLDRNVYLGDVSPDQAYRRLPTEQLAWATEARANMTAAERAANPPFNVDPLEYRESPFLRGALRAARTGHMGRYEAVPAPRPEVAAVLSEAPARSPFTGALEPPTRLPVNPRSAARQREVFDVPVSSGRATEVIRNPSQADLMRLSVLPRELGQETRQTAAGQLRYIQDANGDVYVFRGWDAIHDDVAAGMDRMGRRIGGYQPDNGSRSDFRRFGYLRRDGDTFVSGNGEPLPARVQEIIPPSRASGALEPPTRLPVNPTREIAPNGLPIRPSEPFRTSLNGGGDDLLSAARQRPDAGVAGAEQVGRETALARRENDYMPRGANGDVTATDSYPFGFNRAGPFATQEPTVRLDQFMATDREGSIPYLPALNAAAEAAKKNPPLSQRVRLSNLTATQSVVESNFLNPGRAGQPDAPVVVVQAGGRLWVADGHHRIAAAIARGETDVPALVFGERGHPIELPDGGARRLVTDRAAGSQSSGLAPTAPTASPGPKPTDQKNQTPPRKRGFPFGRAR